MGLMAGWQTGEILLRFSTDRIVRIFTEFNVTYIRIVLSIHFTQVKCIVKRVIEPWKSRMPYMCFVLIPTIKYYLRMFLADATVTYVCNQERKNEPCQYKLLIISTYVSPIGRLCPQTSCFRGGLQVSSTIHI